MVFILEITNSKRLKQHRDSLVHWKDPERYYGAVVRRVGSRVRLLSVNFDFTISWLCELGQITLSPYEKMLDLFPHL